MPRRTQRKPRGPIEGSFAIQLDSAMKLQHLTPEALAALIGISAASVRNWLRGQCLPKHDLFVALENAMNVRFDLRDPTVTKPKPLQIVEEASASNTASIAPVRWSIMEAKLALARSLGVSPDDIQIVVRG